MPRGGIAGPLRTVVEYQIGNRGKKRLVKSAVNEYFFVYRQRDEELCGQ